LSDTELTPFQSAIIASIASAEVADRIGRKWTLLIALVISFVAVGIEFAATTNPVFFVGKLLNGFMVGTIGTVMITYIGEVQPPPPPSPRLHH
jgi:SP family general alpha glucoside:H+ symporter-like MFS transporter